MNVANQIRQKFGKDKGIRLDNPDAFIFVRHILMKEYGWFPVQQYKEMLIPEVWDLLDLIRKDKEQEEKSYSKMRKR